MSISELDNLVRTRSLKTEPATQAEFEGLIRSGMRRLTDAAKKSLAPESRFDLAYNAAHALSLAALRWHGYRSEHRYLVFQCLVQTIGLSNAQCRVLDGAHRKRNLSEYEGDVEIDEALLDSLLRVTNEVAEHVNKLGRVPT
ncbi:MAG: hypothetical protein H7Z15_05525 [Rhizobacter sp.]|nr:hypothetical protein [Rhizobacter sp.]